MINTLDRSVDTPCEKLELEGRALEGFQLTLVVSLQHEKGTISNRRNIGTVEAVKMGR